MIFCGGLIRIRGWVLSLLLMSEFCLKRDFFCRWGEGGRILDGEVWGFGGRDGRL